MENPYWNGWFGGPPTFIHPTTFSQLSYCSILTIWCDGHSVPSIWTKIPVIGSMAEDSDPWVHWKLNWHWVFTGFWKKPKGNFQWEIIPTRNKLSHLHFLNFLAGCSFFSRNTKIYPGLLLVTDLSARPALRKHLKDFSSATHLENQFGPLWRTQVNFCTPEFIRLITSHGWKIF